MSERRTRYDIVEKILEIAKKPITKTTLMYKAHLNHGQLKRHLTFLLKAGLIQKAGQNHYQITDKGRGFLVHFKTAKTFLIINEKHITLTVALTWFICSILLPVSFLAIGGYTVNLSTIMVLLHNYFPPFCYLGFLYLLCTKKHWITIDISSPEFSKKMDETVDNFLLPVKQFFIKIWRALKP